MEMSRRSALYDAAASQALQQTDIDKDKLDGDKEAKTNSEKSDANKEANSSEPKNNNQDNTMFFTKQQLIEIAGDVISEDEVEETIEILNKFDEEKIKEYSKELFEIIKTLEEKGIISDVENSNDFLNKLKNRKNRKELVPLIDLLIKIKKDNFTNKEIATLIKIVDRAIDPENKGNFQFVDSRIVGYSIQLLKVIKIGI